MRAVLDTNEYISALVFGGIPREILERAERGDFELVVSAHIRDEIERVLADNFDWSLKRVAQALDPSGKLRISYSLRQECRHHVTKPTIGFSNVRSKLAPR